MADFGKIQLTNTGINTLVKAQAGSPIIFTKIKMGSGIFNGNVKTLTDIVETQMSEGIIKGTLNNNTYIIESHFTNENLAAGFYWRELGLYVQDVNGNDVLFGYANAGNTADYIPATTSEIYSKHIRVAIAVGEASNITISLPGGIYVDSITFGEAMDSVVHSIRGEAEDILADHRQMVVITKAMIGLGNVDNTSDKNKPISDAVQNALNTINDAIKTINKAMAKLASTEELNTTRDELDSDIEEIRKTYSKYEEEIDERLGEISLANIGDGTITGAIQKLYEMVTSIPNISSGTSEPSGGNDGDVYILHE